MDTEITALILQTRNSGELRTSIGFPKSSSRGEK